MLHLKLASSGQRLFCDGQEPLEPVEFSCELVDFLDQFGLDDDGHAKFFVELLQQLAPLELLYSPGVESKMFASVQDLLEDEVICWVNRVRGHLDSPFVGQPDVQLCWWESSVIVAPS